MGKFERQLQRLEQSLTPLTTQTLEQSLLLIVIYRSGLVSQCLAQQFVQRPVQQFVQVLFLEQALVMVYHMPQVVQYVLLVGINEVLPSTASSKVTPMRSHENNFTCLFQSFQNLLCDILTH